MPKAYHGGSTNGLEEISSPGSSSLTSESSPDTSGETTTADHRPPARSAESRSEVAQGKTQTNSDASLTGGSTRETSRAQQNQQDSSGAQTGSDKGAGSKRK